jgi:hypothetical protein
MANTYYKNPIDVLRNFKAVDLLLIEKDDAPTVKTGENFRIQWN